MPLSHAKDETWFAGRLLAFSALDGATDFEAGLVARTVRERPGLDIVLPGYGRIRFDAPPDIPNTISGDAFRLETPTGVVRGAFIDTHHLLIEGPCEISSSDAAIAVLRRNDRALVGSARLFDPARIDADLDAAILARGRWLASQRIPDALTPRTRRTLAGAMSVMKTQVCSPEGLIRHRWTTPDRWPHRRMWLWDSVFHAIGWRHIDPPLARDMLGAVFDAQADDGFVPHMMSPNDRSAITQPPILALGVQMVQEVAPDAGWLAEMYPRLKRYLEWDLTHRDSDGGGLAEWAISGDPLCRSGESGMDNSPRFDRATRLDAVDFNAYLALECEILADFATQLGREADVLTWRERHRRICEGIRSRLWVENPGIFVDYDLDRGAPSEVLSSAGFLPLICGAPKQSQARRLVEHLDNPGMFGTPLPVPSVAACDTAHYAKDMWRGPVWVNVNWLIARGLERYGFGQAADTLRRRTRREIEAYVQSHGTFFEFYDDRCEVDPPRLLRKGRCAPEGNPYHQVFHDYGWTATLYVDLVLGGMERD